MDRVFFEPSTSIGATDPWSREDAVKYGYTRWTDIKGCEKCGDGHPRVRFLDGDGCTVCMSKDADAIMPLWKRGEPSRPEPWSTSPERSRELGIEWIYGAVNHPNLCQFGPHLRKTHLVTGRCVGCEEARERAKFLAKGPRARARASGENYYRPTDACPSCGKTALRHVVTNACRGCMKDDGRRTESRLFAEQNPDFIIGRDEARLLGFTLYRTGERCRRGHQAWRYVSTGNCIECMRGDK